MSKWSREEGGEEATHSAQEKKRITNVLSRTAATQPCLQQRCTPWERLRYSELAGELVKSLQHGPRNRVHDGPRVRRHCRHDQRLEQPATASKTGGGPKTREHAMAHSNHSKGHTWPTRKLTHAFNARMNTPHRTAATNTHHSLSMMPLAGSRLPIVLSSPIDASTEVDNAS